jgi:hypothetical protein
MKLCATCSQPLGANNTTGICGRCWLIFEEAQKRVHKVRSRGQLTRRQREQRERRVGRYFERALERSRRILLSEVSR